MIDIPALRARISDPREIARVLGVERGMKRIQNGVLVCCVAHADKSPSMRIALGRDGKTRLKCFACGFYGDIIDAFAALEGDRKRGLDRFVAYSGESPRVAAAWQEPERLDVGVYAELAERALEVGRLDGRRWVWPVERYLAGRRLLELARGDGWAALPPLRELLRLAEGLIESPAEALVGAKLARWDKRGKLVASWGEHRLVIPWRGPGGRICALQRRVIEPRDGTKYVLPWLPEWPYGSNAKGDLGQGVAIVEGAVDTLAMRALHPAFTVLGIPGINNWRPSWANLTTGGFRVALDRGKLDPNGIVREDVSSARIALDCAGRGQETERVLEWMLSRHRRGCALCCVLCGAEEAWLCRGCGRRRAPAGQDWAEVWRAKR